MSLMLHEMLVGQVFDNKLLLIGNSVSITPTIAYPAGIQTGDLIVLIDRSSSGANPYPAKVVPAGFIEMSSDANQHTPANSARQLMTISYRIAPSALTGTVTGQTGSVSDGKVMYVFRKGDLTPISSVTATVFPSFKTSVAPLSGSITIPAASFSGSSFLFSAASARATAVVSSHTLSPEASTSLSPDTFLNVLYANFQGPNSAQTVAAVSTGFPPLTITAAGMTIT